MWVFEVKLSGHTQSNPKPSGRGHLHYHRPWVDGGPNPHPKAFVGDNFLPHFVPLPLPASHKWLPRKHRAWHFGELRISTQEVLSTGADRQAYFMQVCFQEAQPTAAVCRCFLFPFWFPETLGCTWVPFANYSPQPGTLDTLLLILPKWNLSFSPVWRNLEIINLESRALTKIFDVTRCYEITRASNMIFWIGSSWHINLINSWI